MINLHFNIRNPRSKVFKNFWCRSYKTPITNKFIELEFYKDSSIVSFNFDLTVRQSHSGLDFEVGLLGFCVHFMLYDNRHWNHEKDKWERYDQDY
jgi:hypothetical protein